MQNTDRHLGVWLAAASNGAGMALMATPLAFPELPAKLIFFVGLVIAAVGSVVFTALFLRERRAIQKSGAHRMMDAPYISMTLFAIGFIVSVVWAYSRSPSSLDTIPAPLGAGSSQVSKLAVPQILVECNHSALPTIPPPEGRIYTMEVGLNKIDALDLGEQSALSGGRSWDWGEEISDEVYQCDIKYLSKEMLFNIRLRFDISILEVVAISPEARTMGKVINRNMRSIRVPELSPERTFSFYVFSRDTFHAVEIQVAKIATGAQVGSSNSEVTVVPGRRTDMIMFPRAISLPAASQSSPTRQASPKGK